MAKRFRGATIREIVMDEDTQNRKLIEVLDRICERAQPLFKNPIKVAYDEPRDWVNYRPFFYVAEVEKNYLFGIIPHEHRRKLFVVYEGFVDERFGNRRQISSQIFDPLLLEIAREELKKYADFFQISLVKLEKYFAS